MKHTILASAILALVGTAHAGYDGPNEPPAPQPHPSHGHTPAPVAPSLSLDFGGRADSHADAKARAAAAANSTSNANATGGRASATGGDARATTGDQSIRNNTSQGQGQRQGQSSDFSGSGGGGGGGGSSGVNQTFQGAQAGSGDRLMVLPNIPATPASSVPGAAIASHVTACGPRMHVDREEIEVHNEGLVTSTTKQQGWTYRLVPASDYGLETFEERGGRFYGHQAILTYAVVSTGYARQLVLGGGGSGGGSGGGWGQGGVGGSGANQQLVTNIQLIPCVLPASAPAPQIIERIVIQPSPVMMPVARKAPRRHAAPVRPCYEMRSMCPVK